MTNLKEACRYSNFLDTIIYNIETLFESYNSKNRYKVVENHLMSKGNPNAEDVIQPEQDERIFTGQLHDMVFLYEELINERLKLTTAISKAKSTNFIGWKENGVELDLDSAVSYNKKLRSLCKDRLSSLLNLKDRIEKTNGRSYMINNEGNQIAYTYPIEKEYKVDFDKKIMSEKTKKLLEKADKISILIDEFMLKQIVDFVPTYSLHDTVEDIIRQYEER